MSSLKIFKLPDKASNNGEKIEILSNFDPPAVIGRGALLKCAEKKVSRNHASIDWDDDGIIITSTHSTPTYTNINGQLKTLNKGEFSVLKNGDQFGLLADSFWYEISLSTDAGNNDDNINRENVDSETPLKSNNEDGNLDTISLRRSAECDERNQIQNSNTVQDTGVSTDAREENILTKEYISAALKIETITCPIVNKESSLLFECKISDASAGFSKAFNMKKSESKVTATESSRQRALPIWMLSGKSSEESKIVSNKASKNVKHGGNVKKSKSELSVQDDGKHIKKNNAKRVSPVKKDSGNASKKKQYHTISQEYDDHSDLNPLINDKERNLKQDIGSNAISKNDVSAEVAASSSKNEKDNLQKCDDNMHGVSDDDSASGQSSPVKKITPYSSPLKGANGKDMDSDDENKKQRPPCLFGDNCYRRNPAHKKEYSHPGDQDYVPPDDDKSDDDDERPQCEHGIKCYRKNPQHRKAFKHTKIPQPRRRASRSKRKRDEDDDSDNEYDTDDPFLNDDSSDDYAPTDDDSDSPLDNDAVEEGDTKRMLKEAKKFTKKNRG